MLDLTPFLQNLHDTKIGNSAISDSDMQSLQEDLRKISAWWEMPFITNKCHILQVGTRNQKYEYIRNEWSET